MSNEGTPQSVDWLTASNFRQTWPLHHDIPDALPPIPDHLDVHGDPLLAAAVKVVRGHVGGAVFLPWLRREFDEGPCTGDGDIETSLRGASIYDVHSGWGRGIPKKQTKGTKSSDLRQ